MNGLRRHKGVRWFGLVLGGVLLFSGSQTAQAFQFDLGEVQGSLDTTLSYGVSWRTEDVDKKIVGRANGGFANSVNGDDGNLNYDDDSVISNAFKITSDLELEYQDFGVFLRGSAFYDIESMDQSREKAELTDDALDLVGKDADLLDAYLWWNFDVGSMPAQLRLGDQVLSWGESTFIQNSINTINPFDVSKLRVPGAELREALLPVGMVSGSVSVTDNFSLEGFYQYDWENTEIDPLGSYWSTNDIAGDGATKAYLGFGNPLIPDFLPPGTGIGGPVGVVVPRTGTEHADDDGQFGLALRYVAPELNETEFGLYFINYHSRLPIISGRTGSLAGLGGGDYAASSAYFTEYPENIKLYGASFNTQLSGSGVALQGEYSYRQDVPLQVSLVELLYAALSPLDGVIGTPFSLGQLGPYGFGQTVDGYKEMDVSQVQFTATKTFGPSFGANQWVVVGEVGLTHVHNMPDKDTLRFEAPGAYTSANNFFTAVGIQPATENEDAFADATSWGYRLVTKLDYNDAIGAVTLSPRLAWAHDVYGTTPGPGGNFVEHRKAVTIGLTADYQKTWSADLSYTEYFGGGQYNLVNDRDFIAFNIKYSF